MKQQFDWLDRKEYPFASNYYLINRHRLHYTDEGKGKIILYIHGTPSWSFDFRNITANLRKDFRCISVDHIGFGLSDKPENYDYSTMNHSRTLENFIFYKNLSDITLVVHDFGGPIGLDFAIRHPERVSRIVIMNSWMWSIENEPEFKTLSRLLKSPLLSFLYKSLNFSPKYILPKSYFIKPPKKILKQYSKPFARRSQRNGTLAFAKSILHDQHWFEILWNNKKVIEDKPVLFLWGMQDPIIPPKYLEKFESGFNNANTIKLENCGHFPQEEKPNEVSDAINAFIRINKL